MSEKYYSDTLDNFVRPPCAQQNQHMQQYPTYNIPGTYNMQCDYNYSSQSTARNQIYSTNSYTNCSTAEQLDSSWIADPRAVADIERGLRLSDKMETIEITSKDLSPASCCSNIDLFMPDFYKNMNKATDGQSPWYYNMSCNQNQKWDYSSCSVAEPPNTYSTNESKYFNGQSYSEVPLNDYNVYNGENLFNLTDLNQEQYYSQSFMDINNINQSTADGSNDESDIIVEESDEDATDCSEDLDQQYNYSAHCIICNAIYTPVGSQFFILNSQTPLTMSSQRPVVTKLTEIIGKLHYKRNYLCGNCLSLINTIDNLQLKLESSKLELFGKYEKTCKEHNLKTVNSVTTRNRKKFKNFCGLHSFKCKFCRKLFSFKKLYENHMNHHKMQNRFLCELCGQRFSKHFQFKRHLQSHTKITTTKLIVGFECKTCKKIFRTRTNLKEHENYCSGILPYSCNYENCEKKFATNTKLKSHVKLKHDMKFVAICSICNIGFVKISDYKSHKNTHSTEKKFNCTKCDKSYKTISNLNYHMKFHNEKLPFICSICDKGFMRKEYLESHVNNHNGVKNFSCQFCEKKFVSQKNLDTHIKYHEGNVKKKICNICNKSITTGYEDHLRTHNNLKEFECSLCLMKFNTKGTLAKHRKRKHNNES